MQAIFKRLMSLLLSLVLLVSCVAIGGFTGQVQAAVAPGSGIHYLDAQHAKAMIGFIYDKSKLTEVEVNAGGMYTFLTGGYAEGSPEEIAARIIFLTVARANISQCMSKYDTVLDNSYDQLLEVLKEIAGGDLDDGLANNTLDDIADGVAAGFMLIGDVDDELIDLVEIAKAGYQNTKSLTEKVEQLRQGVETAVSGFFYIWSGSRKNMYTYVDQYVRNRPMKDSCPAAFDTMMAYNVSALKSNMLGFDPILNWASEDHLAVLNVFGDFIYEVQQSLVNYVSYSQTYKTYQVHCPTDVYLYNEDGTVAASIIGNEISLFCDGIYAAEYDSEKILTVPSDQVYTLKIQGTDAGTMDYTVSEYSAGSLVRTVEFYDLPLETGSEYTDTLPVRVCVPVEEYNLTDQDGQTVTPDYDSLPPVTGDITDVVTAEELFAHIPTEVITLVSNALFSMEASVELAEFALSVEDAAALFSAVAKYSPIEYSLIANGEFSYQIIYDAATDRIISLRFDYGAEANLAGFQRRVAELKAQIDTLVSQLEGMTDFEKALYIHDYIVLNCRYDLELLEILQTQGVITGELRSERYSEYSVLVNGTGICGSYALAYRAILNAAGMECIYLSSKQMNHAWNMVKVDGAWYHVDCCWDDPAPDREWMATRTYFLRTDQEMMQLNHYSWTPGQYKSAGTRYARMPRKSDALQKYDYSTDRWYYLEGDTLCAADQYGENVRVLCNQLTADAIACDGGQLYYVEGKLITAFDPDTGMSQPAYLLSSYEAGVQPEKASILNLYVSDQNITYYKNVWEYPEGGADEPVEAPVRVETVLDTERLNSITGIGLDATELNLEVFDSYYLYAWLISDHEVWDLPITLKSSDEAVVSVDEYGQLEAQNAGTATITASFLHHSATCTVTVTGVEGAPAGSCGTNVKWAYDTDTGKLSITGSGAMANYSFATTPWYPYISTIKEVSIGTGVTSIGNYAFAYAMELQSIAIADTVTSIGIHAFSYCTALGALVLPEKFTTIGEGAFNACISLKSINIPKGVKEFKESTFEDCSSLESISIPQGMTSIPNDLFDGCSSLKEVSIPQGVTRIGQYAFRDCSALTQLTIPSKVMTIEACAFDGCKSLLHMELPESVRYISSNLFSNCTSLQTVTLPATLTEISYAMFQNCDALTQITLPDTLTEIDISAFSGCFSLKQLDIPAKVSFIGYSAFDYCFSLERFCVAEENPSYSSDAEGVLFNKNKTLLVAYPAGRTQGHYTVPDTVTELESFCISQNLISLTLGKNVTKIGDNAFWRCRNLTSIVLNKALTNVDMGAFSECNALSHVGYPGSQEEYAKININTYNNAGLTNAPYLHFDFDPATDLVQTEQQLPTCTQNGHAAGLRCEDCGIWLEGGQSVEATGHSYGLSETFAGSCTQAPYEVYVCSDCQDCRTVVGSIAAGHDYVTRVVAPTCTEKGYTLQSCTLCAETAVSDFTAPTGHMLTIEDAQEHCQGHGSCLYRCSVCDYEEYVAADASALQTKTILVEATCTGAGSETVLCAHCDATVSLRFTEATGHTLRTEENGAVSCTVCGTVITPAAGATLSGSIASAGEGAVTLELWSGDSLVSSVSGENGSYHFEAVPAGDYLLAVSKTNHVTRTYSVTVQQEAVTQDVTLYLLGDVNGDGRVNIGDVSRLYSHVRRTNLITDPYALLCANVNGSSLNIGDVGTLFAHVKKTQTLY